MSQGNLSFESIINYFEINDIQPKYYLYTLFNLASIIKGSLLLQAFILQFNYGLIINLFLIYILGWIKRFELKRNLIVVFLVITNLYWSMILNFRDGLISINIMMIILIWFYEKNGIGRNFKLLLLLLGLYFLRNEFVYFVLGTILVVKMLNLLIQSKLKKNIALILVIVTGCVGISLILNGNIITGIKGVLISLLVNNPVKFLLILIANLNISSTWIFTPISAILSMGLCISVIFIAIPMMYQILKTKIDKKEKNFLEVILILSIFILFTYSIEFGAVQDRIKIVSINLLLMGYIANTEKVKRIEKKIIRASGFIFISLHSVYYAVTKIFIR